MDKDKFEALLAIAIVPPVVKLIAEHFNLDEKKAVNDFYSSKVYSFLEREDTGVWHYSPLTLFSMYKEECDFGTFEFPEEV